MGNEQSSLGDHTQAVITLRQDGLHAALMQFIQLECPAVFGAVCSGEQALARLVLKQFNETFPQAHLRDLEQLMIFLERLRQKRVRRLQKLTLTQFKHLPPPQFSCLPCRIGECVTLAYFDTGCSVSCVTLNTAKRLGWINRIDRRVNGVAIGFGCNRQILGCVGGVHVQLARALHLHVDFVVIAHSTADFLLFGANLMHEQRLCIDYQKGEVRFPQTQMTLQRVSFVPSEASRRSQRMQQFKQQLFSIKPNFTNESNVFEGTEQTIETTNGNVYLRVKIFKQSFLALIDSGADSSKISESLAEELHILQLIDASKAKISHGLGSVLSLGTVPPLPIQFEDDQVLFVPFEILREPNLHILLLGSDFFTHYGCIIDFERKCVFVPLTSPSTWSMIQKTPEETNSIDEKT